MVAYHRDMNSNITTADGRTINAGIEEDENLSDTGTEGDDNDIRTNGGSTTLFTVGPYSGNTNTDSGGLTGMQIELQETPESESVIVDTVNILNNFTQRRRPTVIASRPPGDDRLNVPYQGTSGAQTRIYDPQGRIAVGDATVNAGDILGEVDPLHEEQITITPPPTQVLVNVYFLNFSSSITELIRIRGFGFY